MGWATLERGFRKPSPLPSTAVNNSIQIVRSIPTWAQPLIQPATYKGAWGGRAGGKSHFFAESVVEALAFNPDMRIVCIREIQKSLKFSAKILIEDKIRALGVSKHFQVLSSEIRRVDGSGFIIFQGMQDHTADSIKSLEGFDIAWVTEAQNLSQRSLDLLVPTIRKDTSELWFDWNPDQPHDPIDQMFRGEHGAPKNSVLATVSYLDNQWVSQKTLQDAETARERDTHTYLHIWLGHYNVRSKLQVFAGKWRIDEFEPDRKTWDGAYYGGDWGFSQDPCAAIRCWIHDECLWIDYESWEIELEIDNIAQRWIDDIPGIADHVVRADSSRPDTISHVKSKGEHNTRLNIPKLIACEKGKGSVESGVEFIRSFKEVVIHSRCVHTQEEFRLYQYKPNAAGDPTTTILDKNNHLIDALRYALEPLIKMQSNTQRAPIPRSTQQRSPASLRKIF
jgi:phage terminase large subunit